jgi:hypothetical protein
MKKTIPPTLIARKAERPYFQHRHIPEPEPHYVVWLDVMGSQGAMRRSLPMSTNFVMKLHIACQQSLPNHGPNLELFPVIDGVYITCPTKGPVLYFVKEVMSRLALTYIFEDDLKFKFMVRGAMAFGPISKGSSFPSTNTVFNINPSYTSHIVLGPALSQAYEDERKASPFGIYVSESARMFAPVGEQPFQGVHHKWWYAGNSAGDNELISHLKDAIHHWFEWAAQHPSSLMYEPARMKEHRALFDEYYSND